MLHSPPSNKAKSSSDTNIMSKTGGDENNPPNVTVRAHRRKLSNDEYDELTAFKMEIQKLFQDFQVTQNKKFDLLNKHLEEVKSQTSTIRNTNQDIEKALEFMNDQLRCVQSKIDGLEKQRNNFDLQISNIEQKCDFLEKALKKTSIELKYIPRVDKENKETLFKYVTQLSNCLNITLLPGDVRDVYRIPNKKDPTKSAVIAELSNTLIKNNFLASVKSFNKSKELKVSHLGIVDNSSLLFVSESLTAKTRRLHFLAREFAKTEKYKYCWTSNGNVYVKKQDGSEYIRISDEQQLNKLRQLN